MKALLSAPVLTNEWRLLWRDPATWTCLAIMLIALTLALLTGHDRQTSRLQEHAELARDHAARISDSQAMARALEDHGGDVSRFRDPRNADVVGRRLAMQHALLPQPRTAVLAVGQTDLLPSWHPVSLEPRDALLASGSLEHPRRLALGSFDVNFVVIFIAPLLLLGLLAASPAWERDQGVLRLLASQGVPLGRWLGLRALLRLAVILVPVMLAGLIALAAPGSGEQGLSRMLLWQLQAGAYLLFWTALALWIGSWGLDLTRTTLALLGSWILLLVLLPALVNLSVALAHPQPSRIEYVDAVRAATDLARSEGSAELARFLEDHPEMAGTEVNADDFFATRLLVQQRVEDTLEPMSARFRRLQQAQATQVERLSYLSPAMLVHQGLAELAGTGPRRLEHFRAQVYRYHDEWRAFFAPRVLAGETFLEHDQVPRFDFAEQPVPSLLAITLAVLAGLLVPGLLLAGLAQRNLRRLV